MMFVTVKSEPFDDFEETTYNQNNDKCLQEDSKPLSEIKLEPIDNDRKTHAQNNDYMDLYKGHIIKEEMVIGPETLQPSYSNQQLSIGEAQTNQEKNKRNTNQAETNEIRKKKIHICDICEKGFTKKHLLTQHKRSHTGEKPYQCSTCNKRFSDKSNWRAHIKRPHEGKKPITCLTCNKTFLRKTNLKKHLKSCNKEANNCHFCNKTFSFKANLAVHLRLHTGEKPYNCPTCNEKFYRADRLKDHMKIYHGNKTGRKPHICSTCNKVFSSSSNLKTHLRLHTGEKPFFCSTCNNKFTSKSNLEVHSRLHTGEKPYICSTCDKKFSTHGSLAAHIRSHTGEKPYDCSNCTKKFSTKSHLTCHMKTAHLSLHTGDKPFKCKSEASFTYKKTMRHYTRLKVKQTSERSNKLHINSLPGTDPATIHTREHFYICDVCDMTYEQKSILKKHVKTHVIKF